MYLCDTNVVSEIRKGTKADVGVRQFFASAAEQNIPLYLSAITIGELRRGVDLIQHRGDNSQAKLLADWLNKLIEQYQNQILGIDSDIAMLWGKLRVPHPETPSIN